VLAVFSQAAQFRTILPLGSAKAQGSARFSSKTGSTSADENPWGDNTSGEHIYDNGVKGLLVSVYVVSRICPEQKANFASNGSTMDKHEPQYGNDSVRPNTAPSENPQAASPLGTEHEFQKLNDFMLLIRSEIHPEHGRSVIRLGDRGPPCEDLLYLSITRFAKSSKSDRGEPSTPTAIIPG
jgi:hypothetical protein